MGEIMQLHPIQRQGDAEQANSAAPVAARGQVKMLDKVVPREHKNEADSGKGQAMCQAQERPRL